MLFKPAIKRRAIGAIGICRLPGLLGFLAAVVMLLSASAAKAVDKYWNVPSGNWSDTNPYPWDSTPEPTSSNYAYITNGGTATVTQTGEACYRLLLGDSGAGKSGTVIMSGGSLSVNTFSDVGYSGTGTFNLSAGTNTIIDGGLRLGYNANVSGFYYLSGTGQLTSQYEYIGYWGSGIFEQSGGTNTIQNGLYLGYLTGSSGTYKLNGGSLILGSYLGGSTTGAFNFGGGTLQASANFSTKYPMTLTGINGNAKVDTAGHTVSLFGTLSGTGGLNKIGSGILTLNALNTYSGNTTTNGGTLEIAGGIAASGTSLIDVQSGTATFKTTAINKSNLNIDTAALATFEVVNGANTVGAISGNGITQVDAGTILTAASISQGTLTIGSGATVTIQALPGGPQGGATTPVPEPNAFVLLAGAFIMAKFAWSKKRIGPRP